MLRNSAVIGCGQTKHASKRREVNLAEMVSEAAWNAINDAELDPNEIDAIIVGNMQGFGGIAQPELWLSEWVCGEAKPVLRVTTGGTTGGSVGQAAFYAVASGLYDKVQAIAWE